MFPSPFLSQLIWDCPRRARRFLTTGCVISALSCAGPRPAEPARAPATPGAEGMASAPPAEGVEQTQAAPSDGAQSDRAQAGARDASCDAEVEAPVSASAPLPRPSGYDRWLSGYPYPYPVHRFALSVQGEALCMAYMDQMPAQPNGRVVLLLHGKNFSGAYWHGTAEALLRQGYRVIMPDQIGFGKSSKPTDIQYSFALLARNTSSLLDSLGISRVSVIGHSMGGMLAARWAAQYPERTEQLVLVNPIGLEDYRQTLPYLGVDGWREQAERQGRQAIQHYMQTSYFHDTWRPEYEPLVEIQAGWAEGPDRAIMASVSALTSDMIYTQPAVYDFPNIRVPTLLVIGQADRTAPGKGDVPPDVAARLGNYPLLGERAASAIPGAMLVRLPGVGHLPQYEAFERWERALMPFLLGAKPAEEKRDFIGRAASSNGHPS
jgi:pimeloyl-ACP methyl ester carboxylesterase